MEEANQSRSIGMQSTVMENVAGNSGSGLLNADVSYITPRITSNLDQNNAEAGPSGLSLNVESPTKLNSGILLNIL